MAGRRPQLTLLRLSTILLGCCALSMAVAGDGTVSVHHRPPGWECRWCPTPPAVSGTVGVGVGAVSNDAFRFGRYNGLEDEGAYGIANGEVHYRGDEARYADATATDLGLETRGMEVEAGKRGRYAARMRYDELQRLETDSARTAFRDPGTAALTLPDDWVPADTTAGLATLDSNLRRLAIGQERRRIELDVSMVPSADWVISARISRDTKEGIKILGGAIGPSFGATSAALLPEPVDYTTDEAELKVAYAVEGLQAEFGYYGSFFNDGHRSLEWQNPFADPADDDGAGQLALPPDNRAHQLFATIGYDLMSNVRLTANLAWGRAMQDERPLPYTVNPALQRPLPRRSADARVDTRLMDVKLSSRVTNRLRLGAEYRDEERDNRTPQNVYDYVIADAADSNTSRVNLPYSFEQKLFRFDGGYAVSGKTDASFGYDRNILERSFQEAEETSEDRFWARVRASPHERVDLHVGYEDANRDYDTYDPMPEIAPAQNPLMRKFYMADRDRKKATAGLSARVAPAWTLGISAYYNDDEYSRSAIGLQEAKDYAVTLDASFNPGRGLGARAYYTRERIESRQAGSQAFSTPDWRATTTDTFDTLGVGLQWTVIPDRFELAADYVYTSSTGSINASSAVFPAAPLPDLETERHTFRVQGTYMMKRNAALRFGYLHEAYSSDDWTVDGVEPDSIPNVLGMGVRSPSYSTNVYTVAIQWHF